MFKFSKRSITSLLTCEEALQRLAKTALETSTKDFTIICGYRSKADQDAAVAKGNKKKPSSVELDGLRGGCNSKETKLDAYEMSKLFVLLHTSSSNLMPTGCYHYTAYTASPTGLRPLVFSNKTKLSGFSFL
jgi:hypothetical protein